MSRLARCIRIRSISSTASSSSSSLSLPHDLSSSDSPFLDLSRLPPRILPALSIAKSDFLLYPTFLDAREQHVLLAAALQKLDSLVSPESRRRLREFKKKRRQQLKEEEEEGNRRRQDASSPSSSSLPPSELEGGFLPEEAYTFEKEHFDGVIESYREATVSAWPEPLSTPSSSSSRQELESVLRKIYDAAFPDADSLRQSSSPPPSSSSSAAATESSEDGLVTPLHIVAHALHLASDGYIDPHVDNLEASGSVIAGVSLGSERIMHMQAVVRDPSSDDHSSSSPAKELEDATFSFRLPPGSLYVQRSVKRKKKHHYSSSIQVKGKLMVGILFIGTAFGIASSTRSQSRESSKAVRSQAVQECLSCFEYVSLSPTLRKKLQIRQLMSSLFLFSS
jgi:alkylated DNA repair protein alkB family protein 7